MISASVSWVQPLDMFSAVILFAPTQAWVGDFVKTRRHEEQAGENNDEHRIGNPHHHHMPRKIAAARMA